LVFFIGNFGCDKSSRTLPKPQGGGGGFEEPKKERRANSVFSIAELLSQYKKLPGFMLRVFLLAMFIGYLTNTTLIAFSPFGDSSDSKETSSPSLKVSKSPFVQEFL